MSETNAGVLIGLGIFVAIILCFVDYHIDTGLERIAKALEAHNERHTD